MGFHLSTETRIRLSGSPIARVYARTHEWMYRLSGGRLGARIRGEGHGGGPPVLLLTTTGRRTGRMRTSPLLYLRAGEDFVVAASNAGNRETPKWWRNLLAEPHAVVQLGRERMRVVASEVTGPRRDDLWRRYLTMYEPLRDYQRATARPIPLVALRCVERTRA
jgi:deazaflavin-dependent oxidoreductase (nitroreductase family)